MRLLQTLEADMNDRHHSPIAKKPAGDVVPPAPPSEGDAKAPGDESDTDGEDNRVRLLRMLLRV